MSTTRFTRILASPEIRRCSSRRDSMSCKMGSQSVHARAEDERPGRAWDSFVGVLLRRPRASRISFIDAPRGALLLAVGPPRGSSLSRTCTATPQFSHHFSFASEALRASRKCTFAGYINYLGKVAIKREARVAPLLYVFFFSAWTRDSPLDLAKMCQK